MVDNILFNIKWSAKGYVINKLEVSRGDTKGTIRDPRPHPGVRETDKERKTQVSGTQPT